MLSKSGSGERVALGACRGASGQPLRRHSVTPVQIPAAERRVTVVAAALRDADSAESLM
jgi:hypothetical protein